MGTKKYYEKIVGIIYGAGMMIEIVRIKQVFGIFV